MQTEVDIYAEIIDETVIEDCEMQIACEPGLKWLRSKSRTFNQLKENHPDWWNWLAEHTTLPVVLEKLATDSVADVRRGAKKNKADH